MDKEQARQRQAWNWKFWTILAGLKVADKFQPGRVSKHADGKTKPANWFAKQKRRKQIADRSRKVNRRKR
jgi:hypothetical protein